MLIDIPRQNLPLCPNGLGNPVNVYHARHVDMVDAAYGAYERDEGGEAIVAEAEKVFDAIANGRFSDRMLMYRDTASFVVGREAISVESFYFRCSVCGLILPAARMPNLHR